MSTQFKVGDRVRAIGYVDGKDLTGKTGRVCKKDSDSSIGVEFDEDIRGHNCDGTSKDSHGRFGNIREFELITNKLSMQNLKEKFVQIFLSEPEKSFRKAGITNSDGILTEEGQEVFLTWVLKKYGPEFKTDVVDKLLEEEKE